MALNPRSPRSQRAQGFIEYALLLVLVALAAAVGLSVLGVDVRDVLSGILGEKTPPDVVDVVEEEAPFLRIKDDFLARIESFYEENNRWPRSWGRHKFTDIGLDPADWKRNVEGIRWNPVGDTLGLSNAHGDSIQIYVDDLEGNTLHLYDGWNIWCPVRDSYCYYHTVAPENKINLDTLQIVER
ncbi:MAG: hypothetical protein JXA25_16260 [Anaerolineales bacterium]|nr:hypothetical protein [Anaerolineales bacterium]